jgi:hypothetical protein
VLAHLSEEIEQNDIISFHGDDIPDVSHVLTYFSYLSSFLLTMIHPAKS